MIKYTRQDSEMWFNGLYDLILKFRKIKENLRKMEMILVVVFNGILTGKYYRIMWWWSDNLGQVLLQYYTFSLALQLF